MLKNIFSTYLYAGKCDVSLTKFKKHILDTREKNKQGLIVSNRKGWQSNSFNKINNHNQKVFEFLNKEVDKVTKNLNLKDNIKLRSYWYNINNKFCFNVPHTHADYKLVLSGVLYITTPKNSGNIVFTRNDPVCDMMYASSKVNNYNEYTSSNFTVIPKEKVFLLFSSGTPHYVEPSLSNQDRISISFNYGI